MTAPEMTEVLFDVRGEHIPAAYQYPLWQALTAHLPALADDKFAGVVPLRGLSAESGHLLPRRTKMILRLPDALDYSPLLGKTLTLHDCALHLGDAKLRRLQPYSTLHAHLVVWDADEADFIRYVQTQLSEMGIAGKLICGMRNSYDLNGCTTYGYSLVIHELKPAASLLLQRTGLGPHRGFGCGIFIPYKVIADLD